MRIKIIVLIYILFSLSCTKKESEVPSLGTIKIDVQSNDISFDITRVGSYTDSIYINFYTKATYNCNLYRLNYAIEQNSNNSNYTLGNTYYEPGFCVYGNFPATAKHKRPDLKLGKYSLQIISNNTAYSGSLEVTATQYIFNWNHDNIVEIKNKTINK